MTTKGHCKGHCSLQPAPYERVSTRAVIRGRSRPHLGRRQRDGDGDGSGRATTAAWAAAAVRTASYEAQQDVGQATPEAAIGDDVDEERRRTAAVQHDEQQPLRHVRLNSDRSRLGQHHRQLVDVGRQSEHDEHQRRAQLSDRRRPDVLVAVVSVRRHFRRRCALAGLVRPTCRRRRVQKTDQRHGAGARDDEPRNYKVDHYLNATDYLRHNVQTTSLPAVFSGVCSM